MRVWMILVGAALTALPLPAMAGGPVNVSVKVEADGSTTLTHQALIDAPAADVWNAISTAEG